MKSKIEECHFSKRTTFFLLRRLKNDAFVRLQENDGCHRTGAKIRIRAQRFAPFFEVNGRTPHVASSSRYLVRQVGSSEQYNFISCGRQTSLSEFLVLVYAVPGNERFT